MRPFWNKTKWLHMYMFQFLKKLKLCTKLVQETVCTLSIHIKIYLRSFAYHNHLRKYFFNFLRLEHHMELTLHL